MPPILLLAALALLFGCKEEKKADTTFTDERDGNVYKYVKIGEQTWMAENLNYGVKWSVCYDNKAENCAKYGRLYNWDMAMKVCPKGWHLPKNEEWDVLYKFVDSSYVIENGGSATAGRDLKATSGWNNNGNGTDTYGFAALPGGGGNSGGSFGNVGYNGYWWSASEGNAAYAYYQNMEYTTENSLWYDDNKAGFQSVRCVRD